MRRIAIDAMGGDNAPKAIIDGVLKAKEKMPQFTFVLYGSEAKIREYLDNEEMSQIEIINTTEEILGTDEPVKAIRTKKDSSMVVAANAVKNGEADALMSLGNTGALLASGIFIVGRIKGVNRPALMPTLPSAVNDDGFILIDAGANASAKPEFLVQWAQMANIYAKDIKMIDNPRIALLNNGTEDDKGDELHQQAYKMMAELDSINFIGNIEANEVLNGHADIVVSDGFTGNAMLKSIEGTAEAIVKLLKNGLLNNGFAVKMGAGLIKPALKDILGKFDTSKQGGAVLMGAKAPVVKSHGRADDRAVYYTLLQIGEILDRQLINNIENSITNEL